MQRDSVSLWTVAESDVRQLTTSWTPVLFPIFRAVSTLLFSKWLCSVSVQSWFRFVKGEKIKAKNEEDFNTFVRSLREIGQPAIGLDFVCCVVMHYIAIKVLQT